METYFKKLFAICQKLLPVLLSCFLLSFVWTKSWSLITGLFYASMVAVIPLINLELLHRLRKQWPAFFFIGWFSLSSLWSPPFSGEGENMGDTLRYALCITALFAIFCTSARDKIHWQWLPFAAALPTLVAVVYFYMNNPLYARMEHFGKNTIGSGHLFAFFSIIALYNLRPSGYPKKLILNAVSLAILFPALLLTQSRGPILGFLVACAAITGAACVRRFRPLPYQASLILLILLITSPKNFALSATTQEAEAITSFLNRGTSYRTEIWKSTLDQMPGHWLVGHGLDAPYNWLQTDYVKYGIPFATPHLHSLIFWSLYHGGLIGLGLMFLLIIQAVRKAVRYTYVFGDWLPLALLAFGLFCCIFGGGKYLYRPRGDWIIFWIPVCYALTCRRMDQEAGVGGQRTEDRDRRSALLNKGPVARRYRPF